MASPTKRWPKAANEIRNDAINQSGDIRVEARAIRKKLAELQAALQNRDFNIAWQMAAHLDDKVRLIDSKAEIIVTKLSNFKLENDEDLERR